MLKKVLLFAGLMFVVGSSIYVTEVPPPECYPCVPTNSGN